MYRSNQICVRLSDHRSGTKSFLQRQVELTEMHDRLVDRVELFKETHTSSSGELISPAAEDAFVSFRKLYIGYTLIILCF